MDILAGILAAGVIARVIGALVILVIAWLIALVVSAVIRSVLRSARLNQRMAGPVSPGEAGVDFEGLISSVVFWLIILFGIVAAFDILQLPIVTTPLTNVLALVLGYLPRLFAGIILIVIAWVVARILRAIVTQALTAANIDQRLASSQHRRPTTTTTPTGTTYTSTTVPPPSTTAATGRPTLAESLGEVIYWLTFLFFLPAILGALGLDGLLAPVQGMVNAILVFLPNIAAAAVILVVGYFVARIVQRIVTELLAATGIDRLTERTTLGTTARDVRVSDIVGTIVFVLIIIPVITAALNTLGLAAVTQPLSAMLATFLAAIPAIFAAAIILAVAFFLGRIVADLIARILAGLGLDRFVARLGLTRDPALSGTSVSDAVGHVIFAVILVSAAMEASTVLGFGLLADLLSGLLVFGVRILLGLILFAIGLWIAGVVYRAVMRSGMQQAGLLANVARVSIVVLATAMALRETGLANEIVVLAFGLTLGAVAVAAALAFGLGGREVARQQLETWRAQAELNSIVTPARGVNPPSTPPTTPTA